METLKEMGIPDHLTCLLRNLYVGQEATVRTLYRTTDWFKTEKGMLQGYLLSPSLFNLYAEHIKRNAGLHELQAGINIGGTNINNFIYEDDTTLLAESAFRRSPKCEWWLPCAGAAMCRYPTSKVRKTPVRW